MLSIAGIERRKIPAGGKKTNTKNLLRCKRPFTMDERLDKIMQIHNRLWREVMLQYVVIWV